MGSAVSAHEYPFTSEEQQTTFATCLRLAEYGALLLSLVAARLHVQSAGSRITRVTLFHIAHALYCFAYASAKVVAVAAVNDGKWYKVFTNIKSAGARPLPKCTWLYVPYDCFNVFLIGTLYIFYAYWHAVYSNSGRIHELVRKSTYGLLLVCWFASEVYANFSPCTDQSYTPLLMTYHVLDLVCLVEVSILLYSYSFQKGGDMCISWSTQWWAACHKASVREFLLYCILAGSYFISILLSVLEISLASKDANSFAMYYGGIYDLRLLFSLVLPSYLMLIIMWKRHYTTVSSSILDLRWSTNAFAGIHDIHAPLLNSDRSLDAIEFGANEGIAHREYLGPLLVTEDHGSDDDADDDEHNDSDRDASEDIVPLELLPKSDYRLIPTLLTSGLRATRPLTSTLHIEGNPGSTYIEDLRPSECALPLTHAYLSIGVIPYAEKALRHHKQCTSRLLNAVEGAFAPQDSSAAAAFEQRQASKSIQAGSAEYLAKFEGWVSGLKATVSSMSQERTFIEAGGGIFKPSSQKKNFAVACVATNLQSHRTKVEETFNGSRDETRAAAEVNTVTFGACAAHSLKFKAGGLRQLAAKLATAEEAAEGSHNKGQNAPHRLLQCLQLNAAVFTREAVVVSQALGGVVASCIEQLTDAITHRNAGLLRQMASSAGLLVHSVSLLSTQGDEAAMLDDFAGAYERLHVQLRLTGDPTNHEGDTSADRSNEGAIADGVNGSVDQSTVRVAFHNLEHAPPDLSSISGLDGESQFGAVMTSEVAFLGHVKVTLHVSPPSAFAWVAQAFNLDKDEHAKGGSPSSSLLEYAKSKSIRVVPVLFTLGVNEQQTLANARGHTALQTSINRAGCDALDEYYTRYTALPPQDRGSYHGSGGVEASIDQDTGDDISDVEVAINPRYAGGGAEADALLPEALNLLRNAVETEAKKRSKLVSSLLLRSAHVARLMHGARTTSCKSAKDRTSVFQTLEVVRLADPTRGPALFTPQGLRQSAPLRTISKTGSSKDVELDSGRKDNESIDSIRSDNVDDDYNANDDDAAGGGSRSNKNDVMSGSAAAADERTALNTLRGIEGVRLRNAELNMGRFKYAFNKLQLEALPQELRPPAHTASGGKS